MSSHTYTVIGGEGVASPIGKCFKQKYQDRDNG